MSTQVRSILAQPERLELVVADDGSSDRTLELVRQQVAGVARNDVSVHYLPANGRLGVTANFERAVRAVRSDLVALSDQDDRWHDGRLERLVARFDSEPSLLLVFTDADLVDGSGEPLGSTLFAFLELGENEREELRRGDAFVAFIRRNLATGATVVFRRQLLTAALPFPTSWVHDEWLAAIAAALGGVGLVEEPTIDYRLHDANQIGMRAPTLRHKVSRVLEPRGERNRILAERFEVLAERLDGIPGVPEEWRAAAHSKAAFERRRAGLSRNRLLRLGPVLRMALSGRYGRFASRGRADVLRDLLQPGRPSA